MLHCVMPKPSNLFGLARPDGLAIEAGGKKLLSYYGLPLPPRRHSIIINSARPKPHGMNAGSCVETVLQLPRLQVWILQF